MLYSGPFVHRFSRKDADATHLFSVSPFSSFSHLHLNLLLELSSILARVALLPNKSYSGRADNNSPYDHHPDQIYPSAGVSRPGTFLLDMLVLRDDSTDLLTMGAEPRAWEKAILARGSQ